MTSVAIVGTGFGGLAAAVRLKQAGIEDLVLFERSDDAGGVWRENTYPGAACDVMSHLYSLSFAPKAAGRADSPRRPRSTSTCATWRGTSTCCGTSASPPRCSPPATTRTRAAGG